MQQVTLKDSESFENLLRRFNKKVHQSGSLTKVKRKMYFEKPLTKRQERESAIRRNTRRQAKYKALMGRA